MSRKNTTFIRLANGKTTLVLLILLAMTMAFGLVVPQHVSGEAIGHSYSSSLTQVVTGLRLHHLETSWLTQLLSILLVLNLIAIGLRSVLRIPNDQIDGPARSPSAEAHLPIRPNQARLDEWLRTRWPRSGARLESRDEASGRLGFRTEASTLILAGAVVLCTAAIISSQQATRYLTIVEGADDAANARFTATQVLNDAELPWKPPFEMECNRSTGSTLSGARECIIVWNGKRHEATVRPGTDLEFLGMRLTLVGLERLPLSGSLDIDVTYADKERSRTTSAIGSPLDIKLPDGRITALLGGVNNDAPVGLLTGKVPTERIAGLLEISARPRAAMKFRITGTAHMPFIWIGCGVLLLGLLGLAILPSYRIHAHRLDTGLSIRIAGFGALAKPERLLAKLHEAPEKGGDS